MTALQKTTMSSLLQDAATWKATDDLVRLDQVVRLALDDPRLAASQLACWLDRQTTHHEGSDVARTLDNWAYDPSAETLDVLAWTCRATRAPLPVRIAMMAILAGALAKMGDDPATTNAVSADA